LDLTNGLQKAEWLKNSENKQFWKKKTSDKVQISDTFKKLFSDFQTINSLSIGAKDIPICLLEEGKLKDFTRLLTTIYPKKEDVTQLCKTIIQNNKPILIVWITGFKPKGDDSRPDRGLVPLARMLFGNDIDILTIVYGPAKENTWKLFKENPNKLPQINGLWEAVFNLSNFILADSDTSDLGALVHITAQKPKKTHYKVTFPLATVGNVFSEHDVDTAIHRLFSKQEHLNIFEGMCNPPGGDWSGVSVFNFDTKDEFRWTSLPRVSAIGGKRPDHVIQILHAKKTYFLVIESKGKAIDLENNIGHNLSQYLKDLFKAAPTAYKIKDTEWKLYDLENNPINHFTVISVAAFLYKDQEEMIKAMEIGRLDAVFAFELSKTQSKVHLKISDQFQFLDALLKKIMSSF
jgi:hypothetical protein